MTEKQATIIFNPMSGRAGRRAEDVRHMVEILARRGIKASSSATTGPGTATKQAAAAVATGVDIIISYGGDGTLNEVIQGVAGSRTPLAVWPGGTSNVVARDLGVSFEIGGLAEMISICKTQRIALGLARSGSEFDDSPEPDGNGFTAKDSSSTAGPEALEFEARSPGRYFVMMAGIGLDASIARSVNHNLKRRAGELAYWLSGIKHLFKWRAETFTIEVDGKRYEAAFALVGNGKGYGGGMVMTPGAKLDQPWFEIYILPPLSNNFAYLRALGACMRGRPEIAGVSLIKGTRIKANSSREPWVEADGELLGPLPMTFEIVPDALSVIVP
ncbi:MAG TPA: YegS/Rv2252/BmrU family lipid kinase [Blastocatellia bacterium]|nr:YegS/Rv2252/BmrU family lipid kinase [Blastocatellia bacterium]